MKLAIIGSGFRVPLVFEAVATGASDRMIDEITLIDTDAARLSAIERVITEMAASLPRAPRVTMTTDTAAGVKGADFVFSAVRVGGTRGRTIDERVALNLGLLGQETIGAGGLAYAMRTVPVADQIAKTIAEDAPGAFVINFTNPAGLVTEVMRRTLGDRVVGICDTPIGLVRRVCEALGVDAATADYDYAGINHLGWLHGVRVDGRDLLPELLANDELIGSIEEARTVGIDWVRATGAIPNEYLYYYWFQSEATARILQRDETRGEFLDRSQGDFYREVARSEHPLDTWRETLHEREATYMSESREGDRREEDIAGGGYQAVAMQLMTAIATGKPARMILDVANNGRIAGLPDDVVVEVPCDADGQGVRAREVAPVPLDEVTLMGRVRAAERLSADAALTGDADAAWQAFAVHPLVDSPVLGRKLIDGYRAHNPQIAELFEQR